jgi:hypothetical protein
MTPGCAKPALPPRRSRPMIAATAGVSARPGVPAAVLSIPFDLMRHDLLTTLKPVPADRITAIVDELFLPLIAAYRR